MNKITKITLTVLAIVFAVGCSTSEGHKKLKISTLKLEGEEFQEICYNRVCYCPARLNPNSQTLIPCEFYNQVLRGQEYE